MNARISLRKLVILLAFSSILLGLECPPLVMDSIKTGTVNWVGGSAATSSSASQLADYLFGLFSDNTNVT